MIEGVLWIILEMILLRKGNENLLILIITSSSLTIHIILLPHGEETITRSGSTFHLNVHMVSSEKKVRHGSCSILTFDVF